MLVDSAVAWARVSVPMTLPGSSLWIWQALGGLPGQQLAAGDLVDARGAGSAAVGWMPCSNAVARTNGFHADPGWRP